MSEIIDHGFRVFSDDNYDCDYEFTSSSDKLKQDENSGHHKPLNDATRNVSLGGSRRKKKNTSASQNRLLLGIRTRKHCRDSDSDSKNSTEEKKSENARIVIRKTLEVDDPIEAANSSIRTTLQNNNNNNRHLRMSLTKGGGFFRGIQQNNDHEHHERRTNQIDEASSTALEFNPAAFSRSLLFHEISR